MAFYKCGSGGGTDLEAIQLSSSGTMPYDGIVVFTGMCYVDSSSQTPFIRLYINDTLIANIQTSTKRADGCYSFSVSEGDSFYVTSGSGGSSTLRYQTYYGLVLVHSA